MKFCSASLLVLLIGSSTFILSGCPCDTDPRTICLRFTGTTGCSPNCGGPATTVYNDGARNNASVWDHVLPMGSGDNTVCLLNGLKRAGSISVLWVCYDSNGNPTSVCFSDKIPVPKASCDDSGDNTTIDVVIKCKCF